MVLVGHWIVGGGTGRTTILKTHSADAPQAFDAMQVTDEMPTGKQLPDGGLHPTRAPFTTVGTG